MAKFEMNNLSELMQKFDSITGAPGDVKGQLIRSSAEKTLDGLKADAPKCTGESAKHLKILETRVGDEYMFIDIGINHTNWEQTKGLWFQNFYGEKSTGKNVMWMDKSFKKSKRKIGKEIKHELTRRMGL